METVNIISAIILYFLLPILIIFGVMMIIRKKRQRDAGRYQEEKNIPINQETVRDIKAEEAREARHSRKPPKNIDPETGKQPEK